MPISNHVVKKVEINDPMAKNEEIQKNGFTIKTFYGKFVKNIDIIQKDTLLEINGKSILKQNIEMGE